MGAIRAKEILHSNILRIESAMNNLWGELNTANIPHNLRVEIEQKLKLCEDNFRFVLEGHAEIEELDALLCIYDRELALAVIKQAENEIPKSGHCSGCYLALENICHELNEGRLTPIRARHAVKDVMRRH